MDLEHNATSLLDPDLTEDFPHPVLAIFLIFVISSIGFLVSTFLLIEFLHKSVSSAFQKLCLVKTVPNVIVCSSFLFWVIPLSLFPLFNFSRLSNALVGQVAGVGAYLLGPLIQVCMAANRFLVLYFPIKQMKLERSSITKIAILISVVVASVLTASGIPEECGYVYDPSTFTWNPEPFECAEFQLALLSYIVFCLTLTSNSFNVVTAVKLLCFRTIVLGVSEEFSTRRRKRRLMMFIQSVVQDCLHVIDLINCSYIYALSDNLWFQFTFLTVSFVLIYALDGVVMLYFHPEMHPKWLRAQKTKREQTKVCLVSTAASQVTMV